MLLQQVGVLNLQVIRAVLEAEEVTGRHLRGGRGGGTPEAQLLPGHHGAAAGDANQVTNRVEGHLRVVSAGLDAQVAVAALRFQRVPGHVRDAHERLGQLAGETEAVLAVLVDKEATSQAEGNGQVRGGEVHGLAGVLGRRLVGTVLPHELAGLHPGGGLRPLLEEGTNLFAVGGLQVQCHEVHAVLHLGGDAALVLTVEGVRVVRGTRGRARCRSLAAGV